jgi:hypothetical protein
MPGSIRPDPLSQLANQAEQTIRARAKTIVDEIALAHTVARLTLRLSRRTVQLGWGVVLFFHLFNASYALALAYLYHYMSKPSMTYYVELLQMMPQGNFKVLITLYSVISAMNFYSAWQMVFYTIYYRHMAFGKVKKATEETNREESTWMKRFRIPCSSFVSGLWQAISVRGGWFDDVLLLREVAEIASQTVQAHSSSLLINSVWVNQVFAALIFFNTFSNILVHMALKKEVGWRRFICTAVDLGLDFTWGFILPGKIIYQYFTLFVRNNYQLPYEFSYSDTEMIKAILECDQFFMSSWLDAVTTTLPYLNMLSGLRNIKLLLQHDIDTMMATSSSARIQPIVAIQGPLHATRRYGHSSNPDGTVRLPPGPHLPEGNNSSVEVRSSRSWHGFLVKTVYVLMPLLGLLVLITSLVASRFWLSGVTDCVPGCRLQMHPWFTTHCGCSVLEINCYEYGINGEAAEMDAILTSLDTRTLNSLIITHCPALAITSTIQSFSNLLQFEIYNSTVVEWTSEASISATHLPRVGAVFIVRSTLGDGIPDGLMTDLSPSLIDVEFIASNLGPGLPDDLDAKWPDVTMLFIEHCRLQEFPRATARMALTDFSLVGNNISVIPDDLPEQLPWMYVYMDSNPLLDRIPDSLDVTDDLEFFSFQSTGITDIPRWLGTRAEDGDTNVYAHDTPFCRALASSRTDDDFALAHCSDDAAIFSTEGVFPLAMKDEQRKLVMRPASK